MIEPTVRLGKTDLVVPRIGVGAMTWGKKAGLVVYGGTDRPEDEDDAFRASLESGVTLFDTAEMYGAGNSERRVGELIKGTNAIVATKYYPYRQFPPFFPRSSANLPESLDASLARLGQASVDLYQIHHPAAFVSIQRLMDRLADAVEAGKTRAVGVSNYSEEQMREAHAALAARGIPLASNQVQYSLLYRRPELDGVLKACTELGVTLLAYMPLAMGALSGKYRPGSLPADTMRRRFVKIFRPAGLSSVVALTERLQEIGTKHGKTPAQVALRWVIEQGAIPIPGAKNGAQARENAGALTFSLSQAEVSELSSATADWIQKGKWTMWPSLGAMTS
jgi:aryl-alcohol dehydrogenase-like predicted oxidoreductase